MAKLAVSVDHVATLRQARQAAVPDPVTAAAIAELAGARGIAVHLREDRRHIQDRDVSLLRQIVKTKLNLEMAASHEMLKIALSVKPDTVTLMPERREDATTEGGLETQLNKDMLKKLVRVVRDADVIVSLLLNPEMDQIKTAVRVEAQYVQIHTGAFCEAHTFGQRQEQFVRIQNAVKMAHKLGLGVTAGYGLNYQNIGWLLDLGEIEEFIVGHAIIARAVMVGLEQAVRDMVDLIGRGGMSYRGGR
ncbi:MAG: pyridoxine 5'-phosphate synthase [Nitrospirota bacterium]